MSILDDAIRQHLELKRAHGADDSELKRLEDEAFGPPQRPDEIDPFAEAPTEFLVSPGETPAAAPEIADETARSGRRLDIADLQEAPPAPTGEPAPDLDAPDPQGAMPVPSEELAPEPSDLDPQGSSPPPAEELAPPIDAPAAADEPPALDDAPAPAAAQQEELAPLPDAPPPSPADAAEVPLPPPADEAPAPPADGTPAPEAAAEPPSGELEIADHGPDTEERHAIADQPTQMFDVQAHVDAEEAEAPAGQEPLDTRGPEAEVAGHPPVEAAPTEEESAEYDFFNEQRLSDELDQALEAPLPPTDEHIAMPRYEDAPAPAQGAIFDFESADRYEEDPSEEVLRRHNAPEAPAGEVEDAFDPDTGHEDVLEDTPRFLEDQPEDDDLWFEQKPPKDFDL